MTILINKVKQIKVFKKKFCFGLDYLCSIQLYFNTLIEYMARKGVFLCVILGNYNKQASSKFGNNSEPPARKLVSVFLNLLLMSFCLSCQRISPSRINDTLLPHDIHAPIKASALCRLFASSCSPRRGILAAYVTFLEKATLINFGRTILKCIHYILVMCQWWISWVLMRNNIDILCSISTVFYIVCLWDFFFVFLIVTRGVSSIKPVDRRPFPAGN